MKGKTNDMKTIYCPVLKGRIDRNLTEVEKKHVTVEYLIVYVLQLLLVGRKMLKLKEKKESMKQKEV